MTQEFTEGQSGAGAEGQQQSTEGEVGTNLNTSTQVEGSSEVGSSPAAPSAEDIAAEDSALNEAIDELFETKLDATVKTPTNPNGNAAPNSTNPTAPDLSKLSPDEAYKRGIEDHDRKVKATQEVEGKAAYTRVQQQQRAQRIEGMRTAFQNNKGAYRQDMVNAQMPIEFIDKQMQRWDEAFGHAGAIAQHDIETSQSEFRDQMTNALYWFGAQVIPESERPAFLALKDAHLKEESPTLAYFNALKETLTKGMFTEAQVKEKQRDAQKALLRKQAERGELPGSVVQKLPSARFNSSLKTVDDFEAKLATAGNLSDAEWTAYEKARAVAGL